MAPCGRATVHISPCDRDSNKFQGDVSVLSLYDPNYFVKCSQLLLLNIRLNTEIYVVFTVFMFLKAAVS